MNKMTRESILQMGRGAFAERADYEMRKVIDNILDPNTKATANMGEWVPTEQQSPKDDTVCLVLVSGRPMANITLHHALELAEYNLKDGWIMEMWPEWETPTVTHWMPLPDADMEGLT